MTPADRPHRRRTLRALFSAMVLGLSWVTTAGAAPPATHLPVDLPLLRPTSAYPRIFVQATLPDGSQGLFLVDTGADISVLSTETAERLGLDIQEDYATLEGLSGTTQMNRAVLPRLSFSDGTETVSVDNIELAVGVRGMTDTVQFMTLDGLLGNNVWSHFVLEVDYPANRIVLHPPDGVPTTRRSQRRLWSGARVAPMVFDGAHIYSPVELTTPGDPPAVGAFIAQIDTGAGDLTLCARTGQPFETQTTEGLEIVRGIGASDTLPPHRFLERTRRIGVSKVRLGGRTFDLRTSARWMAFEDGERDTCPAGMRALLGHHYLDAGRVFFDYGNGRMALRKSRRPATLVDGHRVLLDQDIAEHGEEAPERFLYRAKLRAGSNDVDGALALLEALPTDRPPEEIAEARVLMARMYRYKGQLDDAWNAISFLTPPQLVDQNEIIGAVNGLVFEGRLDEARALATEATQTRPDASDAWVALADVELSQGETEAAARSLHEGARALGYPDAHLLRRARVAQARDDRYGSMAHIRKLLQLYPYSGEFLWFYALLIEDEDDRDTFRADMREAMARLHPDGRPLDFQVAALHALGEQGAAESLMDQGIAEVCDGVPSKASEHLNCQAWFWALAGVRADEALDAIQTALADEGPRSDFLDTMAMVRLSRGELDEAVDAAFEAARLSPDDVYMLWQAERLAVLRDRAHERTEEAP